MKRYLKTKAKEYIFLLEKAHAALRELLERRDTATVLDVLEQCQDAAIEMGTMIEKAEGEGHETVKLLEEYCEMVYQIYTVASQNQPLHPDKVYKQLKKYTTQMKNSIQSSVQERIEAVFLPYKASMWDSLESVWLAAREDPDCDAYVIPIPYYDRNPDGSVKEMHYEGNQFPEYVPIMHYEAYDFEKRRPDLVFIHNPYDECNYVTSVHPFFYSSNLKQYAELLVYIPYYSTSGGMSEAQSQCPAYYYADYIIMQAEKYRKFFDAALPQEKLRPLGSPKFDRIIRLCQNPPKPPRDWTEKMAGKKVYFYNTSINGMLANTKKILKKMEYVFHCFEDREDACLLWRPHPLLPSTFASMRSEYQPVYENLKQYFIEQHVGIYDDTPDMTETIAFCDAYIGDAATSVTSIFGIAGKPLFILNNDLNSVPADDDWRGQVIRGFSGYDLFNDETWMIVQGNKLYRSKGREYSYHYFCDLSSYAYGNYYGPMAFIGKKRYICPINAQDLVELDETGIKRRIPLKPCVEQTGAFYSMLPADAYIFLLPNHYPAIVRYDTAKDELTYYDTNLDVFTGIVKGERCTGGVCVQRGKLYMASPSDRRVLSMDVVTGAQEVLTVPGEAPGGWMILSALPDDSEIWLLPYTGNTVTRWNPVTGEVREYGNLPEGFVCRHPAHNYLCMERSFNSAVPHGKYLYLSPNWGNMYVRLDTETGETTEWKPPVDTPGQEKNGYYASWAKGALGYLLDPETNQIMEYLLFTFYDRKTYQVDFDRNICTELPVTFDREELKAHEPGFWEESQWLQYSCNENAFNSLPDFLDGKIAGAAFDKERKIRAFSEIAANPDGTSGEKIYEFARRELEN